MFPLLRARISLGPEEEPLEEGETQRAGAARILPALRAPCDPSHCVRSRLKFRERWPRTSYLRRRARRQAPSPGIQVSPQGGERSLQCGASTAFPLHPRRSDLPVVWASGGTPALRLPAPTGRARARNPGTLKTPGHREAGRGGCRPDGRGGEEGAGGSGGRGAGWGCGVWGAE